MITIHTIKDLSEEADKIWQRVRLVPKISLVGATLQQSQLGSQSLKIEGFVEVNGIKVDLEISCERWGSTK